MNYIIKNPVRIERYIEFYGKKNKKFIFDKVNESIISDALEETQHYKKSEFYRNQTEFIFMFNAIDDQKISKISDGVAVIPYTVVLDEDSLNVNIYIE
ncbi:hypothetical protein [Carnobacterium maltaromaticum]|uniref:hypothetical protein n=1 Tax=Carnobacterium maltaromaticum TaxID=2751 RepID=UPI00295F25FF|nr:hypothetical protein [Carnobacterium maltaromaticum]